MTNYEHHLSQGQFECLGENTEKYITSSIPIKQNEQKNKMKHVPEYKECCVIPEISNLAIISSKLWK